MEKLFPILEEGVTASHTIAFMKREFLNAQYEELNLENEWNLQENGKYYVNLYGTNGLAFRLGKKKKGKPVFRVAMAHSDYPNFQIKPNPEMKGQYVTRLNVEIYGGMYQKSWLDRPLGVAGKVIVAGEDAFRPNVLLYRSTRPLCIIPSLAIHLERELNKKGALDTAKELVPIAALSEQGDLIGEIAKELGIREESILDYELSLFNMDRPVVAGLDASMIASPRLDNLTSVAGIIEAMQRADQIPEDTVDVAMVFDNEEVGSLSKQGADSALFSIVLDKIGRSYGKGDFRMSDAVTQSFLLSVDVAQGHHPNYEEKSDATNKAYLGKGLSIKRSIGQKYGTTAESSATVKQLCERSGIPYTIAINKTGIPGGSTLGPIVTSHLPFPCADIGMPILAMHSASELGATADYEALRKLLIQFYTAF